MKRIINPVLIVILFITNLPICRLNAQEFDKLGSHGYFVEKESDVSGFWKDQVKPVGWIFEKYSRSRVSDDNFLASLVGSEVTIESKTKQENPLTFFKPSNLIEVEYGQSYAMIFEYKTNLIDTVDKKPCLQISFDAYKDGNREASLSKGVILKESNDWTLVEEYITIDDDIDQILPVFKFNHAQGSYSVRNVRFVEKRTDVNLKDIEFVQKQLNVNVGDEIGIELDTSPSNYSRKKLEWISSDPKIASVSPHGILQAKRSGSTNIRVVDTENTLNTSIQVSVMDNERNNLIKNPGFEIFEKAPLKENTDIKHWHQDVGFWDNNLKASNWIFERYTRSTSPRENFKAMIDSNHQKSGNNSVRIEQKTNWGNSLSFLKPKERITVEPNTEYIYEGYYKTSQWNPSSGDKGLFVQLDAYNRGVFDCYVGREKLLENNDWTKFTIRFKTGKEHTSILPVFRMEHTDGLYWVDDVKLYKKPISPDEIKFPDHKITIEPGQRVHLEYETIPYQVDSTTVNWKVENDDIISVENGSVFGKRPGISKVYLCSMFDSTMCDSMIVHVKENIEIEQFSFSQKALNIAIDKKHYIEGQIEPKYAPIEKITFVSRDDSIAEIYESLLIPKQIGTVAVDAIYDGKTLDTLLVNIRENTDAEIQGVIDTWEEQLLSLKIDNSFSKKYQDKVARRGENLYQSMQKSDYNRTSLWPETKPTHSSNMTDQFRKLKDVVLAFRLRESALYESREVYFEILSALQFLYEKYGYDGNAAVFKGNWWDYQIGSTKAISDILIMLDRYTNEQVMEEIVRRPSGYVPNAVDQMSKPGHISTGANRTDIAIGVLATGLIRRDKNKINQLKKDLLPVFELVESGDGIYSDGSMIQHEFVPYTGGYGAVYLDGVATILSRLKGSPWEIDLEEYDHLYEVLEKGFIPLIYKGKLMAMVQGRGMSRSPKKMKTASAYGGGYALTINLLSFAELGPQDFKEKMYYLASEWLKKQSREVDFLSHIKSSYELNLLNKVLLYQGNNQHSIMNLSLYPSMDRVVYHHSDFGLGISMYSSRIANFESFSGENGRGWYTGDGMIYIYTDDSRQFGVSYWPTVNPYRLPGVTLDTRPLQDSSGERMLSSEDFVGGAGNGRFASIVFTLNKNGFNNQNLQGNKSYFIMDDKLIFLGSEIKGKSSYEIKTIYENRIFDKKVGDKLYIGGNEVILDQEIETDKWVSLESKEYASKVSYLPISDSMIVGKEKRTGTYQEINSLFGDLESFENNFIYIEKKHGKNVENGSYAYMSVINYSEEEIEKIYLNNPIKILSRDNEIHALYDSEHRVIAANVYCKKAAINIDKLNLPVRKIEMEKGSYVFEFHDDRVVMHVSDPSQKKEKLFLNLIMANGYSLLDGPKIELHLIENKGQTQTLERQFYISKEKKQEIYQNNNLKNDCNNLRYDSCRQIHSNKISSDSLPKSHKNLEILPFTGENIKSSFLISTISLLLGLIMIARKSD